MSRVGLLVPSVNTVAEPEFWRLIPTTSTLHAARMRNSTCDVNDAYQMLDHAVRAADELGSANVNVIAFACTASSFVAGKEGERRLRDQISTSANAPAVTTSGAVVDELRSIGARRIALYTPYPKELNLHETRFLAEHGIETVSDHGLGISTAVEIADVTSQMVLDLIARNAPPITADAIFLSCTNLATIGVIRIVERTYDLPVLSSNSTTFAAIARQLDWKLPAALGYIATSTGSPTSS